MLRTPTFDERFDTFWNEWGVSNSMGLSPSAAGKCRIGDLGIFCGITVGQSLLRNDLGQLTGYAILVGVGDQSQVDYRQYLLADALVMDDDRKLMARICSGMSSVHVRRMEWNRSFSTSCRKRIAKFCCCTVQKPGAHWASISRPATRCDWKHLLSNPDGAYFSLFDGTNLI